MSESAPKRTLWPLAIVLLLFSSAAASFGALWMAGSDGGVEVIPDYYKKAVNFDSLALMRKASDALSWESRVEIDSEGGRIYISDSLGSPVIGLTGWVDLEKPGRKSPPIRARIQALLQTPGMYTFQLPDFGDGLWLITVSAYLDAVHYTTSIRKNILLSR